MASHKDNDGTYSTIWYDWCLDVCEVNNFSGQNYNQDCPGTEDYVYFYYDKVRTPEMTEFLKKQAA